MKPRIYTMGIPQGPLAGLVKSKAVVTFKLDFSPEMAAHLQCHSLVPCQLFLHGVAQSLEVVCVSKEPPSNAKVAANLLSRPKIKGDAFAPAAGYPERLKSVAVAPGEALYVTVRNAKKSSVTFVGSMQVECL